MMERLQQALPLLQQRDFARLSIRRNQSEIEQLQQLKHSTEKSLFLRGCAIIEDSLAFLVFGALSYIVMMDYLVPWLATFLPELMTPLTENPWSGATVAALITGGLWSGASMILWFTSYRNDVWGIPMAYLATLLFPASVLIAIIAQSAATGIGGLIGLALFVFLIISMFGGGDIPGAFATVGTYLHALLIIVLLIMVLSGVIGTLVVLLKKGYQVIAPHYVLSKQRHRASVAQRIQQLQRDTQVHQHVLDQKTQELSQMQLFPPSVPQELHTSRFVQKTMEYLTDQRVNGWPMAVLVYQQEEAIQEQLRSEEYDIEAKLRKHVQDAKRITDDLRRSVETQIDRMADHMVRQKQAINDAAELRSVVTKWEEEES